MGSKPLLLAFVLFAAMPREAQSFGVLTHEAIIDAAWDRSIAPLLRSKFQVADNELNDARAFAYGGCLIQDLGYYPFSSRTFGDLTHYIRSGDFVLSLLAEATNANEYAFALGALAHYTGDTTGHPEGINRVVPLLYPKLHEKYGDSITYEQNRSAHLKTEFGLDVVQIARGNYLAPSYHRFIGFEIAKPALERAFLATYGLRLKDVFANFDLSEGSFRYSISTMIPQMSKVAWQTKEKEIRQLVPGASRDAFVFAMTRPEFEREFGTAYERPGIRSKILAVLLRIIPKVGPFAGLAFRVPTPDAERLFVASFSDTVTRYESYLGTLANGPGLSLANLNFDTGQPVRQGEYRLADEAYRRLLERVQAQHATR